MKKERQMSPKIACPQCGSRQSRVLPVQPKASSAGVERVRFCLSCRAEYTTLECVVRVVSQCYEPEPPVTSRTIWSGVYFFSGDGLIKIGASRNVLVRCRTLALHVEGTSAPLAWIHNRKTGSRENRYVLERSIHRELSKHRVRGEWFRDCPEVRSYIAEHGRAWPI